MNYKTLGKGITIATIVAILGGAAVLASGCKTQISMFGEQGISLSSQAEENAAKPAEGTSSTLELITEDETTASDEIAEEPKDLDLNKVKQEINNIKNALYKGIVIEYAYTRADDCFFLTKAEWKYMVDDITKNMENSKYYPIIDAMLKAKMLNHNGKIIGYVKNNKEFNTAEKLIKKINESLDGVLCNYEAFENPVNKDDLYKHDWVKAGAVGFNFRCCEGKLRLYLNDENEKEDNATFLLSTKKDCIDDLCDAQRVRNAMRQGIIDYAVAYPDNAEVQTSIEMCMKYIGEAN